jgi:enoyl-CoA hydratase/carnithine racemase
MREFAVITPAELADGAAAHPLLDGSASLIDPVLFIDCDAPDDPQAVVAAARTRRILVGLASAPVAGPLAAELGFTLFPGAVVGRDGGPSGEAAPPMQVGVDDTAPATATLVCAVSANPQAAVVLAALLRAGHPATQVGLEAESLAYSTLLGGPEFRRWLGGAVRPAPAVTPVDPVLVRRVESPDADILHITLNRPERRNAYGRELRDALIAALDVARALRAEGPVAEAGRLPFRVVWDGAGSCFCSGGDLAEFGTAPDPVTAHLVRTYAGAALPLLELSGCIEARLHGSCVGAGVELPAFAGRAVAAPDTTFRLPEIGMGLIPGAGGTVSLPRRIGRWRTLYLALAGAELDAKTAAAWGLIDAIVTQATG